MFTNTLDKETLKHALMDWALGREHASYVVAHFRWTSDMDSVIPWEDVSDDFYDALGTSKHWESYPLLKRDPGIVGIAYRDEFNSFIETKADALYSIYQNYIDYINKKIMMYRLSCFIGEDIESATYKWHVECNSLHEVFLKFMNGLGPVVGNYGSSNNTDTFSNLFRKLSEKGGACKLIEYMEKDEKKYYCYLEVYDRHSGSL